MYSKIYFIYGISKVSDSNSDSSDYIAGFYCRNLHVHWPHNLETRTYPRYFRDTPQMNLLDQVTYTLLEYELKHKVDCQ